MLTALPALAFGLIVLNLKNHIASRRERILAAGVVWGASLVMITEALSLFAALTRIGVATAWGVVSIGLVIFLWTTPSPPIPQSQHVSSNRIGPLLWLVVAGLGTMAAVLAAIALAAPPNTWDVLTCHLPRVMHWIQNRSVAHYPTHILTQIQLNPGCEFIILHLHLLWGGDRLSNLPQLLALAGCAIGVSALAARLGAGPAGQVLAGAMCMTLPMAIFQATGAKNELVHSFWLVCMTWVVLEAADRPRNDASLGRPALFGSALGLAILTKATALLYAAPFAMWYAFLRLQGPRRARAITAVAMLVLLINLGHGARNYRLFGSPLGPGDEVALYSNQVWGPRVLLSNVLRNLALHTNVAPLSIQQQATVLVIKLHEWMGINSNDPRTTFPNTSFYVDSQFFLEDYAGNGFHIVLFFIALALCTAPIYRLRGRNLVYAILCIAGFLIFCFYLRWQPWHARLHLPFLILASPFVGRIICQRTRKIGCVLAAALLMYLGIEPLLHNFARPAVGLSSVFRLDRTRLLFMHRPELFPRYTQLVPQIAAGGCKRVGLRIGRDDWEYPLWVMLNEGGDGPFRFDHVEVKNISRELPGGFHPDPQNRECISVIHTTP